MENNTSDALQHPPSFEQMVGLIKKLFTDYLEDVMKTPPSEIGKAWERYKTLNHLYQQPKGPMPHLDEPLISDDELKAWEEGEKGTRSELKELNGYVAIPEEDHARIIKGQTDGLSLEMALFNAGYNRGRNAQQTSPAWVKASEFKTDKPVFRPYRRKSIHEGCDYDYGEVFIEPNEDEGLLYLDIDSENNYLPQSSERWATFEILDETGHAYQELFEKFERLKRVFDNSEKGYDKAYSDLVAAQKKYNELKENGDKMALALRRCINTMIVHPDYEPNSEFRDRIESANDAVNDWKALNDKPGEGKEVVIPKEQVIIHNNSDAFRHWVSDIKGYPFALLGHSTGVWLPPGVTLEQFQKEWSDYELANNPAKQKEAKP
jgi:hypothetical protein